MDLFTVSFFGHRTVPEFWKAEERVESLIHTLLLEKEYVEFLVGRNGDFDQIVSSAVKRQQRRAPEHPGAGAVLGLREMGGRVQGLAGAGAGERNCLTKRQIIIIMRKYISE